MSEIDVVELDARMSIKSYAVGVVDIGTVTFTAGPFPGTVTVWILGLVSATWV